MEFISRSEGSPSLRMETVMKPGVNRLYQLPFRCRMTVWCRWNYMIKYLVGFCISFADLKTHVSEHGLGKLSVHPAMEPYRGLAKCRWLLSQWKSWVLRIPETHCVSHLRLVIKGCVQLMPRFRHSVHLVIKQIFLHEKNTLISFIKFRTLN